MVKAKLYETGVDRKIKLTLTSFRVSQSACGCRSPVSLTVFVQNNMKTHRRSKTTRNDSRTELPTLDHLCHGQRTGLVVYTLPYGLPTFLGACLSWIIKNKTGKTFIKISFLLHGKKKKLKIKPRDVFLIPNCSREAFLDKICFRRDLQIILQEGHISVVLLFSQGCKMIKCIALNHQRRWVKVFSCTFWTKRKHSFEFSTFYHCLHSYGETWPSMPERGPRVSFKHGLKGCQLLHTSFVVLACICLCFPLSATSVSLSLLSVLLVLTFATVFVVVLIEISFSLAMQC